MAATVEASDEQQYLDLVRTIITSGTRKSDRTGARSVVWDMLASA